MYMYIAHVIAICKSFNTSIACALHVLNVFYQQLVLLTQTTEYKVTLVLPAAYDTCVSLTVTFY